MPIASFLIIGIIFAGIVILINFREHNRLTDNFHKALISLQFKEQQNKIKTELQNFELSKRPLNFDYSGTIINGAGPDPALPLRDILTQVIAKDLPVTGFVQLSGRIVLFAVKKNGESISYIGKIIDQAFLHHITDSTYFNKLQLIEPPPKKTDDLFIIPNYLNQPIGYIRYFPVSGSKEYTLTMISLLFLPMILMVLALFIFGLRIKRVLTLLRTKTQQLDLKNQEAQLSHENLSHLFESITQPILTADTDGIITSSNSAVAKLFKCSSADLIGELFHLKVLHQKTDPSRILGLDLSKLSVKDEPLYKMKGYKNDNSPFMMKLSINNFPSNVQTGYVIGITDLTEQQRNEDLINLVNSALILVDKDANIIMANQPAKEIFKALDGLKVENEKLVSLRGSDTKKIHNLINRALNGWGNHGFKTGAMRLYRPSGALPYSLVVLPFQAENIPENHEIAVVIVNDPEKPISYSNELLQLLYNLTNTEAVVASALGQGMTLEKIALKLNISRNTVRNHLKNIFKKTGTTRQADLVKILTMNAAFSGIGRFKVPESLIN